MLDNIVNKAHVVAHVVVWLYTLWLPLW